MRILLSLALDILIIVVGVAIVFGLIVALCIAVSRWLLRLPL